MKPGYSVTVSKNGEAILTIEREMLSGKSEISDEEHDAIREAAEHLLSFIGFGDAPDGKSDDELPF